MIWLLLLACDPPPEFPQRAFSLVRLEGEVGPCSCPMSPGATEVTALRMNRDTETPATWVRVNHACEVVMAISNAPPEHLPLQGLQGAWGLNNPPTHVRCPNAEGQVSLVQREASCATRFHNANSVGPEAFSLIGDPMRGLVLSLHDGAEQEMDCGADLTPYAEGWRLQDVAIEREDLVRQVTLSWVEAPTYRVQLQDSSGAPLAGLVLRDFTAPTLRTDSEGRLAWGRRRGPVQLIANDIATPIVDLFVTEGQERVLKVDIHPLVRVFHSGAIRTPSCLLGPERGCWDDPQRHESLCRCAPDEAGVVPLLWSGGLIEVPAETAIIAVDTADFSGQVYGELEGGTFLDLTLKAVGAPETPGFMEGSHPWSSEDHDFLFQNVAPGRYQLVTGLVLETKVGPEFEVGDGPVDLGTLSLD